MSKPIRIAQIIGKWVGGGVESVVMNYYRHLDPTKIVFDFICDNDSTHIPYEEIERLGGRVILIPPYQQFIKYHQELKRVLQKGNYQIVHSHINTLSVFSLYAAKCAGAPIRIAHSHSTTNKLEFKKNILKQILRPFSKTFATNYMCCSEHAGRWLFGHKEYAKGNVYLLNNAIDLDKFKYNAQIRKQKRKELKISNTTLVIGHVGRFVEQKNHRFLIAIFNEITKVYPDSILLLAGEGPLLEEIKTKVKELGLEEKTRFLGQRSDINGLYQAMDLFVLPSLYEGLGMVLIEAQTSGLPCICSTNVPLEAKITNNIIFNSLNSPIEIWSANIQKLLKNYSRQALTKNHKLSEFDITLESKKLENKYMELIERKN